jgi:hypothetical protein
VQAVRFGIERDPLGGLHHGDEFFEFGSVVNHWDGAI